MGESVKVSKEKNLSSSGSNWLRPGLVFSQKFDVRIESQETDLGKDVQLLKKAKSECRHIA